MARGGLATWVTMAGRGLLVPEDGKQSVAVSVRIRPASYSADDEAARNAAVASGFSASSVIGGSDQEVAATALLGGRSFTTMEEAYPGWVQPTRWARR